MQDTIYGAEHRLSNSYVPERLLKTVLEPVEPVAFGPWRWPNTEYRTFMADRMLSQVAPDHGPPGSFFVQAAARDPQSLAYLDGILTAPPRPWT